MQNVSSTKVFGVTLACLSVLSFGMPGAASSTAHDCRDMGGYALDSGYVVNLRICPNIAVLTLDRVLRRDEHGRAVREVVDEIRLPAPRQSEAVVTGFCEAEGVPTGRISALVQGEGTPWYPTTKRAWWADISTERWIALDPGRVRCFNEGYDHVE